MENLLLLYDTKESDLARDFRDLLTELNISVQQIPLSPNLGFTLAQKEKHYFESAAGILFIITPGSERLGELGLYPSPSVSQEIGQAQTKFENKPECVIFLVDEECNMQAINQQAYISFNRKNIRPAMTALIQLIKDLKTAGLFRITLIPTQIKPQPKKFDWNAFIEEMNSENSHIIPVLFEISNKKDGVISDIDLTNLLTTKYKLTMQEINFLKRDLEYFLVVIHNITSTPYYWNSWWLNDRGWSVVRLEIERKKIIDQENMRILLQYLVQKPPSP